MLYKCDLSSSILTKSLQFTSYILDILLWKESLVILCSYNGELILFDELAFKAVSTLNLSIGYLYKSVRCMEEESKVVVCGEKGVVVVEVKDNNSLKLQDETYCKGEWIPCILELN
mmetsp:Transcript_3283/g.2237  ORF Transcript_3283/g.2237 Transcript_3283/m.2237 type:complete len:116 (-) Transcript_3283:439-786(-)